MSLEELEKFGLLRRSFHGTGSIQLPTGKQIEAELILAQRSDGELFFSAQVPISMINTLTRYGDAIQHISGALSDNRPFRSAGPIWVREAKFSIDPQDESTRIIGRSSNWEFGARDFEGPQPITFELVNFLFLGSEWEETTKSDRTEGSRSLMPLDIGGRLVELRWAPDYKQVKTALQARKGVEVTCIATTLVDTPSEIDNVISLIDSLCEVMSVARGTLISWTSCEVQSSGDAPLYSIFRSSVVRNYLGLELINKDDSDATKAFLERGYKRHRELDYNFHMRWIARAFTEARGGPFLETRALLIAVLTEFIAGVQARLDDRVFLIPEEHFDNNLDALEESVKKIILNIFPELNKNKISAMLGKLKEFNRRPLYWKIEQLGKRFKLGFDSEEIKRFVQTRDHLAHFMSFPDAQSPIYIYKMMMHFLDRIMLGLYNYRGFYYDFEIIHRR